MRTPAMARPMPDDHMAAMSEKDVAAVMSELLLDYRHMGIRELRISAEPGACESCRRLSGRLFSIDVAPPIPNPDCSRFVCRCDYDPVLPR